MKRIIIAIVLLLLLLGCDRPVPHIIDSAPIQIDQLELVRIHHDAWNDLYRFTDHGVVCYMWDGYEGIGLSCVSIATIEDFYD